METGLEDPFPSYSLLLDAITLPSVPFLILTVLIIVILLFLSGVISGSEVAFFSFSGYQLNELKDGSKKEQAVYSLISKPKRLLATVLILNNLVNVAIVTLSTYLTWQIFGTKDTAGTVIVLLTSVITFAIVFFGEVIPKVYANQMSTQFAQFSLPLISFGFRTLKPMAWVLTSLTDIIEKRIEKKEYQLSVDEWKQAVEITTDEETPPEELDILKGIVNFGQLTVKQVMRSRVDVTAFDEEIDFHELMDKINKCGYSRIPIYRETIDNILGILYNKDLLPHLGESEKFKWQELLRPGYFVPETKNIDTLLRDFQDRHVHMAIVADEYGGTSGIITMEDIIEEIVGEINDEFDDEEVIYNKINENTFVFEGKTLLHDFSKITETDSVIFEDVKGESESLGGLLIELSQKIPRAGEQITFDRFVFTVVSVDARRIKRVRVLIK